ncbi:shikimate kinase [Streptomyces sp. NPDC102467]|uniref:shikimate kinase n=1 Tax=Streptomyces sp. NPDC102467 TaxID=3366179 RepID=UPI0038088542
MLIGPPASGKTSVGQLLAARLGVGFRDTDAELEAAAGMSVPQILRSRGEAHFRMVERRVVQRALGAGCGSVVALGGGSVLDESVRRTLCHQPVVLLAVGLEQLIERVGDAEDRPLLTDDPAGRLRTALAVRTPLYTRLARYTVTVAPGERPQEVADRIAVLVAPVRASGENPLEQNY